VQNNHEVIDRRNLRKGVQFDSELVRKLLHPTKLIEYAPYSLARRVSLIELQYGVKMRRE
jgi:hypothetical protein